MGRTETQHTPLPPAIVAAAFRRALDEAAVYAGSTAPNPPVGCVLLDAAGRLLAAAAHRRAGEAHAEARAIAAAQDLEHVRLNPVHIQRLRSSWRIHRA